MKKYFFCVVIIFLTILLLDFCRPQEKKYPNFIDNDMLLSQNGLDSTNVRNLAMIGKVWGFVKYHYPNLDKKGIDIDKELFLLLDNANDECITEMLSDWIISLGDFRTNKDCKLELYDTTTYILTANYNWISDTTYLCPRLCEQLNHLHLAKRRHGNYLYVQSQTGTIEHNVEKQYNIEKATNIKYRLLTLFRYWNIIEYYYLYKPEGWNNILLEYIVRFWNASSWNDYVEMIKEITSELEDSHARVKVYNQVKPRYIPINARMVNDNFIIIGNSSEIPIGSEVLNINGLHPKDIRNNLISKEHLSESNMSSLNRDMTMMGQYTDSMTVNLSFFYKQNFDNVVIKTITLDSARIWIRENKTALIPACNLIHDTIAYINAGAFRLKEANEYYKIIKKSKVAIFDLRSYPNDFMLFFLSKFFMPYKTPFVSFVIPLENEPGFFYYYKPKCIGTKHSDKFSGRIVILVNENTISQGEYTAMALQACSNSITCGSQTAGADGNVSTIHLPLGIQTYYTGLGVLYPNGQQTQKSGIKIDIHIDPYIENQFYYSPEDITDYIINLLH